MYRRTKSPKIALARIEAALPGARWTSRRTTIRRLAFAADCARRQRRDDVPQLVRWTGRVPSRGVKGWEEEALEWLRLEG